MANTTLSSQALKRDVIGELEASKSGPVVITDRGEPAHVLLRVEDYRRLRKQRRNIADALAMPGIVDAAFEPPRLTVRLRPAKLSGLHPRGWRR